MNQNKFLKNLNQPGTTAPTPTNGHAIPAGSPPPARGGDYDPIKRLAEELSRQSRAIEELTSRFDAWEKQPRGATPDELLALVNEVRKGVHFTPDSAKLAASLLPELAKDMPSLTNLKTATAEGVNQLQAVGLATAERIERAGSQAAKRIEWAGRSKADVLASQIGFSSWPSAVLIFAGFLVLVGGVLLANQQREAALAQARSETRAVREFTDWVKTQPEGKRLYDRYYHP